LSSNGGVTSPPVSSSEVALEYPDALRTLHLDYQCAGSDVVEAFTYNAHREKMRVIGKEDLLEPLNRAALQIAREVADARSGNEMAGNISNSNIWDPADAQRQNEVRSMFREMVGWAVEGGADLIIGETFYYAGDADHDAALECAMPAKMRNMGEACTAANRFYVSSVVRM
jgi:betaine-homocysteine S-methyltransferase